jgi:hypothetical protein
LFLHQLADYALSFYADCGGVRFHLAIGRLPGVLDKTNRYIANALGLIDGFGRREPPLGILKYQEGGVAWARIATEDDADLHDFPRTYSDLSALKCRCRMR